ncbi:hypothetical protein [Zavarzinia sp.]|uniref:hypothetical protein n=1 Tax=Zavarzinia sp. TaxID=2027920 RepID=UPI003566CF41
MTPTSRIIAALGALAIASIGSTGAYAARAQEGDAFRLPPITGQAPQQQAPQIQKATSSSGTSNAATQVDSDYPVGRDN